MSFVMTFVEISDVISSDISYKFSNAISNDFSLLIFLVGFKAYSLVFFPVGSDLGSDPMCDILMISL
jgi:hypothetical protein